MKKIIINETIEQKLVELMLNESMGYASKVKIIRDYLDGNFVKADYDTYDNEGGKYIKTPLVVMKGTKNTPSEKTLSLEQLYYLLQYKYQKIISNKVERNKFIWNVIRDWYNNKLTKNNNLSKY